MCDRHLMILISYSCLSHAGPVAYVQVASKQVRMSCSYLQFLFFSIASMACLIAHTSTLDVHN